jgi:2'-hydroxyisoflavone reductase
MKLLVLGGTVFLGRHLVDAALSRGHDVTIFTRGRHNPDLFPRAEKLRGDRNGDLSALQDRHWDAVVDTSGNAPAQVAATAALLAGSTRHYTLISTLAVYAGFPRVVGLDESAPLAELNGPLPERPDPELIGPLKALCERALLRSIPGRSLIVRSGLLAGPHDPTDRFTYWPRRVARGGEVLAPDRPGLRVQLIDARDLACWTLDCTESGRTGAYNATGPAQPLTIGDLLDRCRAETGSDAIFTWVDEERLLEAGVKPRMDLPLWMPRALGAATVDCRRALAAGLRLRPIAETVRDTLAWDVSRSATAPRRAGLAPHREAEVLAAARGGLVRA